MVWHDGPLTLFRRMGSPDGVAAWLAVGVRVPKGYEGMTSSLWPLRESFISFDLADTGASASSIIAKNDGVVARS
jgi:hypothetical protein